MIFEELATTTNSLKDLKKKMDLHTNRDLQNNTDTKFRIVLKQTESVISTIEFIYANAKASKNEEILNNVLLLLDILEETVSSGLAVQDDVAKADNAFKSIQSELKKDWSKQYAYLTGPTISTLEAVKGIDPENVATCIQKIQCATSWELGESQYKKMFEGLSEAEELIVKLGLDDEIVTFLQNTNAGKATLKDLNDKVLGWIRDENLEGKIKISFVRR